MRSFIAIALLLSLLTATARADQPMRLQLEAPCRSSGMTKTGKALSIIGILSTAGAIGFGIAAMVGPKGYDHMDQFGNMITGATFAGIGAVLVGTGVPLWVVGARRDARVSGYASASGLTVTF